MFTTLISIIFFSLLLFYTVPIKFLVMYGILNEKHIKIGEWGITPISPIGDVITAIWIGIGSVILILLIIWIWHGIKKVVKEIYKLLKEKK